MYVLFIIFLETLTTDDKMLPHIYNIQKLLILLQIIM